MADSKLTALSELSAPALTDLLYMVGDPAGTPTSYKESVSRLLGLVGSTPGGRLTTESNTAISTSDRTSQGTLYYTPDKSDYIRLYDGMRVKEYAFTERSLSLTLTSGKNNDWFLYDNSGTLTLEPSADWTNDSTRANALTWQTGLGWVKSGAPTRLWLGTTRASGSNVIEDSGTKRFLWNAYNRVPRTLLLSNTVDSWTYATSTIRQANASSANQVEFVFGGTSSLRAALLCFAGAQPADGRIGFGLNSTSTFHASSRGGYTGFSSTNTPQTMATIEINELAAGYYVLSWNEIATNSTMTFYGDAGVTVLQGTAGISGGVLA